METEFIVSDTESAAWEYEQWAENGLQKARDIISETESSESGENA